MSLVQNYWNAGQNNNLPRLYMYETLGLLFSSVAINDLLKEQCHEDFAALAQFCAKIITLRLQS